MEIAHPSSQQAASKPLAKEAIDAASETGIELEAALLTVLPASPSASAPAKASESEGGLFHDAKHALDDITAGTVLAEPIGTLVSPTPVLNEEDHAAAHLAGSSAKDIDEVDRKFQTLLATVRTNRPWR
jgi:hypothetical protein